MKEIMVSHTKFLIHTDKAGRLNVQSCHPYDDAEYHWARQATVNPLRWFVYRNGERVSKLEGYTPEEIPEILARMDAGIKPRMVHW